MTTLPFRRPSSANPVAICRAPVQPAMGCPYEAKEVSTTGVELTQRVTECNGTAVDIHFIDIETQCFHNINIH